MKITWKYVIKRLPSYATLSNLLKTYFQCFLPGGYATKNVAAYITLKLLITVNYVTVFC